MSNISELLDNAADLLSKAKFYINDPWKADDKKAKEYIIKFYNSIFDYGVFEDFSEYPVEYVDYYKKGYYELIKCAVMNKKTPLINEQVGLFALAAFGAAIYEILIHEATLINEAFQLLEKKRIAGKLTMEDYPRFEEISAVQEGVGEIRAYLLEIMALARTYEGKGKVFFNKIEL